MAKITGIGGVFYKVEDPAATRAWYKEHLGLDAGEYGCNFKAGSDPEAITVWNPFAATTDYFAPSDKPFMINFRVDDLDGMVADLKAKGQLLEGEPLDESYGKFAWIIDPDGVKIELWQPK